VRPLGLDFLETLNNKVNKHHQPARDNGSVEPQDGQALVPRSCGATLAPVESCTLGLLAQDTGEEVNGQVRCGADGAWGLKELLGTFLKSNRLRYR
jgi:hypothetical protein